MNTSTKYSLRDIKVIKCIAKYDKMSYNIKVSKDSLKYQLWDKDTDPISEIGISNNREVKATVIEEVERNVFAIGLDIIYGKLNNNLDDLVFLNKDGEVVYSVDNRDFILRRFKDTVSAIDADSKETEHDTGFSIIIRTEQDMTKEQFDALLDKVDVVIVVEK